MNWLMDKNSQLSLENKITIYKAIIKPVLTYGIDLWGCSKPSNTKNSPNVSTQNFKKIT
jgi:hypothetical protein